MSGSNRRPTFKFPPIGCGLLAAWLICLCAVRTDAQGYSVEGRPPASSPKDRGVTTADGQFAEQFETDLNFLAREADAPGTDSRVAVKQTEGDQVRISADFAQSWNQKEKT